MAITNIQSEPVYGSKTIAFTAGVVGGVAMTLLMAISRLIGLTAFNPEEILGSIFTLSVGGSASLLGFAVRIALAGLVGLVYGSIFRRVGRAGWGLGTFLGMIHWAILGVLLGLILPFIHPLIPEQINEPGYFGIAAGGATFILVLLQYLLYGAVVGGFYSQAVVSRRERVPVSSPGIS